MLKAKDKNEILKVIRGKWLVTYKGTQNKINNLLVIRNNGDQKTVEQYNQIPQRGEKMSTKNPTSSKAIF